MTDGGIELDQVSGVQLHGDHFDVLLGTFRIAPRREILGQGTAAGVSSSEDWFVFATTSGRKRLVCGPLTSISALFEAQA